MAFCTKCGQPIEDGKPCPYCNPQSNEKQKSENGVDVKKVLEDIKKKNEEYAVSDADRFERNKKIVPECIEANDGEIPIKQYDYVKLNSYKIVQRAEGRLQVTNKRLIFRAAGRAYNGPISFHTEFQINNIGGIEFKNTYKFSFINLLLAVLYTAIFGGIGALLGYQCDYSDSGAASFFKAMSVVYLFLVIAGILVYWFGLGGNKKINSGRFWIRQALIAPATCSLFFYGYFGDNNFYMVIFSVAALSALINLFMMTFVIDLSTTIKSTGGNPAFEIKTVNSRGLLSIIFGSREEPGNSGFTEIKPWRDTAKAIKEIGAIIDDIQTMGDAAIDKWKSE